LGLSLSWALTFVGATTFDQGMGLVKETLNPADPLLRQKSRLASGAPVKVASLSGREAGKIENVRPKVY
jgi:hypothetical protein